MKENFQGLEETMRWFGPDDSVSLSDIQQCGCTGVMTSLHYIVYGAAWPLEEIQKRKMALAEYNLRWSAVESVPISEAIRTRTGDFQQHIENYIKTIRHLGAEGVSVVIYNFMPVLDWVRTDMAHQLPDGSECLYYDPVRFAAFEIYLLKRPGAEKNYSPEQLEQASTFFKSLNEEGIAKFERSIIDVFPGTKFSYSLDDIRAMLAKYDAIDRDQLTENLRLFLQEIIPVCEKVGVRMAIHPDDPPFSILGLPRIISCEADLEVLLGLVDSPANGICFCTGSLSPRADNNLPRMIQRFGDRIYAVHLRNTHRNPDGSFYEAGHLSGSIDMVAVVESLLGLNRTIPFRPDHGRRMLDDLNKPPLSTPGYDLIGRLQGLSEIRGVQTALQHQRK